MAPHRTASVPCAVCGNRSVEIVAERDRRGGELRNVLCLSCGLVWVDPLPDAEALRRFYADDYRREYKGAYRPKLKHCQRETLRAIERADRFLAVYRDSQRVLDIGAGAGFFAYALKRRGILIDGIEPNQQYADYARSQLGLERIRTGFLQDLPPRGQYDLVTLNHVFEHLREPRAALAHVHSLLADGGQLLLEVPNIEATYHAPGNIFHAGHLYWFNPATIEALAMQVGLAVVERRIVADTAHIDLRLEKRATLAGAAEVAALLAGNAARVAAVRKAHTRLGHYLSATPYVRWLRKARRFIDEQQAIRGGSDGKAVCDALCDRWIGAARPAPTPTEREAA